MALRDGGVYSYYEFKRPLNAALTTAQWKRDTRAPLASQAEQPWLKNRGLGLDEREWSADKLRAWLPAEKEAERFGESRVWPESWRSFSRRNAATLQSLAYIKLSPDAQRLAAKAFSSGHYAPLPRGMLHMFLLEASPELRKSTALYALTTITKDLKGRSGRHLTREYSSWILFSLRLLHDAVDEPATADRLKALVAVLEGSIEWSEDYQLFTDIREFHPHLTRRRK